MSKYTARTRAVSLATLMGLAAAMPPAGAQSSAARDLPTIHVREVLPQTVARIPGAAARLSDEQIEAFRPYTMHDALDLVAGVRTIDDDALGRRSGIGVRGSPPRRSRKLLLLEDGTPINASTYLDSSGHYTPPMERLETVDVLKGTGQIVHGPLNNHGIVNFRNKRATVAPETTLSVGVGSLDTVRRHVMHRRTVGDVGIVAAYTGMNADGIFDVEDAQFDDLYVGTDWAIDARQDLSVSLTHFRERSRYDESNLTPQEYALAPRVKRGRFGQEFNTFALNYSKLDAMYDVAISDRFHMSAKVFATDMDRPRFTVVPGDSPITVLPELAVENPFVPGLSGRMESRNRHYRTRGLETRMELSLDDTAGRRHALQWGLRAEEHDFDDMRNGADGGVVIDEGSRGALIRREHYEASAVSLFVQDSMQLGDWSVTPGLRAERYTQSKVRDSIPNDPGPHAPLEADRNSVLLPGVSLLYDGFRDMQVFAGIQRGYSPAIARTAAGFPLVPEMGLNSQVGVRSNRFARLILEAAVFHNALEDTLVQQVFTIDGLNVTLNSGDSVARGVDFGLRFDSAADAAAASNAFVDLAYNYTNAEFTDNPLDGRTVPEVPRHAGSITLGFEHPSGWQLSGTVSHFGAFYTDVINTVPLTLVDEDDLAPLGPDDDFSVREPVVVGRVAPRTLLSARFNYALPGGRTTLWLQGRNLADRDYVSDLENGMRPGAERTLVGGVQFRL